ncbi:AI-2E family transporter [Clostridium akagii]|uniref:AI-2E family transporter n=1 Tax=Clostridium akagii TaxID=91623 RepID=UPI00056B0923|nr:AI-2E family transporter [Clostridium akagii]
MKNKAIHYLLIINLVLLALMFLSKMQFLRKLVITVDKTVIIPLFLSILIYYIIRPLNLIFIHKGISYGKSSMLTLLIFIFILSGVGAYFGKYIYEQFYQISSELIEIINDKNKIHETIKWIDNFINLNEMYSLLTGMVKGYMGSLGQITKKVVGYFMNTFSAVLLIIIMVYYLLCDGHKLHDKILVVTKDNNKKKLISKLLNDSDDILNHYVTGQAKVALSLAMLIFIGYKIIGMPDAILLASITFILAFIPFVGFFIAMIIPVVIAVSMGISMLIKLMVVFIVVQTLKGRVVVPIVMSKSMNIHPLTDIILVILAVAVFGPFAAFAVVPVYAILKNIVLTMSGNNQNI